MKNIVHAVTCICALTLTGCVSWNTPSRSTNPILVSESSRAPAKSYRTLNARADDIGTEAALRRSIADHQRFLHDHPRHTEALSALANQLLLLGTAYTENRGGKRAAFLQAKRCSEDAMATDPACAGRLRQGAPVWEACEELGPAHMEPMLFWATSVLYMFREGMVFPQQVFETKWLDHAGRMLDHMLSIDRNWSGGAALFSKAIVYHCVPPAAGGDPEKAQAYLAEAIAVGGDWMLPRWGRAKYFLVEPQDRAARAADLRAVLAKDPTGGGEAPYWRRYFQADARRMLAGIEAAAGTPD